MSICIEHLPASQLRPFAECIWYSEATNDTSFDIVPDGCVDVCFVLSQRRPRVMLFGTTTRVANYELEAGAPYFGVRFRPGRASLFLADKISELTDAHCEVKAFRGLGVDQVMDLKDFAARKQRLESELLAALVKSPMSNTPSVEYALREIDRRNGDIRMGELADLCNLSKRQLERLFHENVGIAPKLYARIRRFRSVLEFLEDPSDPGTPKLADVAASYGYTDQSHLVKEFRNFSHPLSATL